MTTNTTQAPQTDPSTEIRRGLLYGVGAYTWWGLFPIFLVSLSHVSAVEILLHRIIWAVPFGALFIIARQQWGEVWRAISSPKVAMMLTLSALAISANWLTYVWAVTHGRILESSLGYYINPLMYVAAGVFILREKLRPLQLAAIVLASIGVVVYTIGLGGLPWIALVLAALFTAYGFLRKTVDVGAMPGLFVETSLLSPIAIVVLFILIGGGNAMIFSHNLSTDILLLLAGPVTVVPLLLFALAARRLQLITVGFLQYIGPTLQFLLGLAYGEAFTPTHAFSFGFIWLALAVFTYDAARSSRNFPR